MNALDQRKGAPRLFYAAAVASLILLASVAPAAAATPAERRISACARQVRALILSRDLAFAVDDGLGKRRSVRIKGAWVGLSLEEKTAATRAFACSTSSDGRAETESFDLLNSNTGHRYGAWDHGVLTLDPKTNVPMQLFTVRYTYRRGHICQRLCRTHVAYLVEFGRLRRIQVSGAPDNPDNLPGDSGLFLVVQALSRTDVERMLDDDHFVAPGVVLTKTIGPFPPLLPPIRTAGDR